MTNTCLFSAPFDFLPPTTLSAYQDLVPTEFREIWKRDQVGDVAGIKTWVPNPGQNFIIDSSVLDDFPALDVIATPSTGTNHINKQDCAARNIAIYSLLDNRPALDSISASPEFTFLLLLNTLRRLDVCMNEVSNDRWRQNEELMRGRELNGKTVGLVGMGRIGQRLKKWCEAFDARIQYYDPYVDDVDGKVETLAEIFSTSDVVCVCCYLTDETTSMIGAAELEQMKHGACLVNTSRGEVIDEADLVAFIDARPDVEVSIDVLSGEVTGTHMSSPLVDLHKQGRIVLTPHIAGASGESQSKAAMGALGCLQKHFSAL